MTSESLVYATQPRPRTGPEPLPASRRLRPSPLPWPQLAASLLTGLLLYACHFPLAWGWLAWVALVPLLTLTRSDRPARQLFLCAWAGGLVFFWPALQWLRVADPRMYYTWAALATYCSLFVPAAVLLVRRLDRGTGLPLVVTVPVAWTALEFFRAHVGTGFAWYFLGHTQHAFLPVIQVSDLAGAYAVTFLVAAVNALLCEGLCSWTRLRNFLGLTDRPALRKPAALLMQAAAVVLLLAAALGYGFWRLGQDDFAAGPRVALVQGNLEQGVRNASHAGEQESGRQAAEAMAGHYGRLSERAANQRPRPDLIVWPETSHPGEWLDLTPDVRHKDARLTEDEQRAWRANWVAMRNAGVLADTGNWGVPVLVGLNAQVFGSDDRRQRYNSAVLVVPTGRALVDGFAVRSEDLAAGEDRLALIEPRPGEAARVGPGQAVRVKAGTPLPAGADAVVWELRTRPTPAREVEVLDAAAVGKGLNVVQPAGRYDKVHRVPFGEYVPLRDWLPWMEKFAPYDFDYSVSAGERLTRFPLADAAGRRCHFGVIICFEDSDPSLARQYARADGGEPAADFLVNISNDGWFDGTSEHEEHLALCRFRAVECRRSVVRAVNMGVSAVIDGNGRVLAPEEVAADGGAHDWQVPDGRAADLPASRWAEFKKVKGVLTAAVPLDGRGSLYAAWGDWLPWGCWLGLGLGLLAPLVRPRSA